MQLLSKKFRSLFCTLLLSIGLVVVFFFEIAPNASVVAQQYESVTASSVDSIISSQAVSRTVGWRNQTSSRIPGQLQRTVVAAEMGGGGYYYGPCEDTYLDDPAATVWIFPPAFYQFTANQFQDASIHIGQCGNNLDQNPVITLIDPDGNSIEGYSVVFPKEEIDVSSDFDMAKYDFELTLDNPEGLYELRIRSGSIVIDRLFVLSHSHINSAEITFLNASSNLRSIEYHPGNNIRLNYHTSIPFSYIEVGLYRDVGYDCNEELTSSKLIDTWLVQTDQNGDFSEEIPIPQDAFIGRYRLMAAPLNQYDPFYSKAESYISLVNEIVPGSPISNHFPPQTKEVEYLFSGSAGSIVQIEGTVQHENRLQEVELYLYDSKSNWLDPQQESSASFTRHVYELPSDGRYRIKLSAPSMPCDSTAPSSTYDLGLTYLNGGPLTGSSNVDDNTDNSSQAQPLLTYVSGELGETDIYVIDIDNSEPNLLTGPNGYDEAEPDWSHNGQYIVYQSNQLGNYDIWIMDADGSNQMNLTSNLEDEREPDWSPLGDQIIYRFGGESNEDGELWVMSIDGSNQRRLNGKQILGRVPVWSPTGRQVAFMSDRTGSWDVYMYDLDSDTTINLTNCRNVHCRFPAWSPDGEFILYASTENLSSYTPLTIWCVRTDGTEEFQIVTTGEIAGRPTWSSTDLVAFNTEYGLEVLTMGQSDRRKIPNTEDGFAPDWSK